MPISGLVITRAPGLDGDALRTRLREVPGLELGDARGARIAAVLTTEDVDGHTSALERLEATPGVLFVELAFHDLSDVERVEHLPRRTRSRGELHGPT